ncbi:MAG: MBOAT family protein [Lachnospiraceae bacterium]|nr:MBOAT family protein [Lachnospiraceae bacterium]
MTFTDFDFLFRFLPVFLFVYYLAPAVVRIYVLIAGSYFFYALFDIRFCLILLLLSLWNYALVGLVRRGNRRAFAAGVTVDVASLVLAKAFGAVGGPAWMPVGMSFYVFRMLFFLADGYRGKMKKEPTLPDSLAFFCLFPQLLSGPIMRYADFERSSAFREPAEATGWRRRLRNIFVRLENGLTWLIFGMAAKVLLADHLRSLWNALYGIGYESLSTPLAWLGVYTYSMELYYDFWGYSLMAAGVGVMIGLPMIENFRQPYAAGGVSEFYRRWHVTLGDFFRENVYIPLGGSRNGWLKTVRNLGIVWLLTGLWHGITVNFLFWAGAVLFMILMERELKDRRSRLLHLVGRLHVLVGIPLTWLMFAVSDTERLSAYFQRLFPIREAVGTVYDGDFLKYVSAYGIYLFFSLVFMIPSVYHYFERHRRTPAVTAGLTALFVLCLISLARAGGNPFLYLQF